MKNIFSMACALLLSLALVSTANAQAPGPRWHNIRFADDFSGTDARAKINAAIADCGPNTGAPGISCVVLIPPGMACGEPNQPPDHVVLWDLRGCAQSTGLRFNLAATTTGNVRTKMYIQDNYNAQTAQLAPRKSSATFYAAGFVDDAQVVRGVVEAINGNMFVNRLNGDMTGGHIIGIEGSATAAIPGTEVRKVWDMRGGTFNAGVGKNVNAGSVTSLYAQAPEAGPGGSIVSAVSLRAEAPTAGTQRNLAGWFNGDVQVDTRLTVAKELLVGNGTPIHAMQLSGASLNFPGIAAHSCHDASMPLAGADTTAVASASPAGNIGAGFVWSAWVETPGAVAVRVCNITDSAATPRQVKWNVDAIR